MSRVAMVVCAVLTGALLGGLAPAGAAAPGGQVEQALLGPCPVAASTCAFAELLNAAMIAGDANAIASLVRTRTFVCPGPFSRGVGDPFPLCNGAESGERRAGFILTSLNSHGDVYSREQLAEVFRQRSLLAPPSASGERPRLYGVGCPYVRRTDGGLCQEQFSLVFGMRRDIAGGAPAIGAVIWDVEVRVGETPHIVGISFGSPLGSDYETLLAGAPLDLALAPEANCIAVLPGCGSVGAFFPWPASGSPAPPPAIGEQWLTFTDSDLRLSFEHPAGCEVMRQRNVARIGERVTVVEFDGEGLPLQEFVFGFFQEREAALDRRLNVETVVGGHDAIRTIYRVLGSDRYGEMTFIERGESVLRVAFEPMDGPCGYEPRIYARILATLDLSTL